MHFIFMVVVFYFLFKWLSECHPIEWLIETIRDLIQLGFWLVAFFLVYEFMFNRDVFNQILAFLLK